MEDGLLDEFLGTAAFSETVPLDMRAVRWWILYAVIGLVALGARLLLVLRGGGLLGFGAYDDGVYYSAAAAFIHGRMPYADFLFIQPPGVVVAGAPFAWLGSLTTDATGFAAAHVAFMIVGSASAVLIAVILRRFGLVAAATGGLVYAIAYVAAYSERSILLEPFGTLGMLVALLVLSRPELRMRTGWLIVGGIALGVATGFKIWYVVPAVVILAWAVWLGARDRQARGWWRMPAGAVIGGCAVYLPFFLIDPSNAFSQIVLDQLGRSGTAPSIGARVHMILGDYGLPPALAHVGFGRTELTAALILVTAAAMVTALTVRGARLYVVLFVVNATVLLAAPSFFLHYTALTSPMLALVIGVAAGRVVRMVWAREGRLAIAGGVAALVIALNVPILMQGTGRAPVLTADLRAQARAVDGCVMADDPTMLAVADVLTSDLQRGCRLWPDVTGYTYGPARDVGANGMSVPRPRNALWQRDVVSYLTSGSAVLLARTASTGLDAASHRAVVSGTVLYRALGVELVRRAPHG